MKILACIALLCLAGCCDYQFKHDEARRTAIYKACIAQIPPDLSDEANRLWAFQGFQKECWSHAEIFSRTEQVCK